VDQDGKPFLYHADRRLPFTHISQLTPVTVDFGYLSDNKFKVRFYDPRFGKYIKETTVENKTVQPVVSPPGEDLVLLIETI
jgi:hypothetical protein